MPPAELYLRAAFGSPAQRRHPLASLLAPAEEAAFQLFHQARPRRQLRRCSKIPGTERSGATLIAPLRVVEPPRQAAIGVALTPAHQMTTEASIRSPRAATPSASTISTGVFRRTSTRKCSRAALA